MIQRGNVLSSVLITWWGSVGPHPEEGMET